VTPKPWGRPRIRVSKPEDRTRVSRRFGTRTFDSKAEAKRWDHLEALWDSGEVSLVLLQPAFYLPGKTRYAADFLVFYADGRVEIEDVKGMRTDSYKRAKKQVEDLYGVEITEVKAR